MGPFLRLSFHPQEGANLLEQRTLQAASFITPVWAVVFLVAALDRKDTRPIPTLELILIAGSRWC